MLARYLQRECNSRRGLSRWWPWWWSSASSLVSVVVGAGPVAALAVDAAVEDLADLLGALGEVLGVGGRGDVVEQVLVVAELVLEAVADALGLVAGEAGVGHGVDDVALLGVVAGAGRQGRAAMAASGRPAGRRVMGRNTSLEEADRVRLAAAADPVMPGRGRGRLSRPGAEVDVVAQRGQQRLRAMASSAVSMRATSRAT